MITSILFGYTVLFDHVAGLINWRADENCHGDDFNINSVSVADFRYFIK